MVMDKIIVRGIVIVFVAFVVMAVLYERPKTTEQRAAYLPEKDFIGNKARGRDLFNNHCIQCHGKTLQGTDRGPSLLHAYYKPEHHADIAIYLAVYRGVQQHHWHFGDMPAMPSVTPEQVTHIIKYVREKQRESGLY